MDYKNILLETKGQITILTLNRPPMNPINYATLEEIDDALNQIESNNNVRVIVITGSEKKCFSAGFDVKDAENTEKAISKGQEVCARIYCFEKPVIAAVNGFAFGGGCELAMACHFRIMTDSPDASIGLTELNLGIMPGWGGTQFMNRILGKSKALDMILFSKRVASKEALQIGLVDYLSPHDEVVSNALKMAGALAKRPPIAVKQVLRAMAAGEEKGLAHGLNVEQEGINITRTSEDAKEGFMAFIEKRDPVFKGQ